MEPTNAQVESLIRNYQSYYQIPSLAKVKSKAEIIGYILKYIRPDDGRLVMVGTKWKNTLSLLATPGAEYPEPAEGDVMAMSSLTIVELKDIVKSYNDYYQIVKNFRDVNKDVKMKAVLAKMDVEPGATKKDAVWFDAQPRFEIIIGNEKLEVPKKLEVPAPLDWEEQDACSNEEEMYVEFTMMEINEFIGRYGANFFLSRLKDENYDAIVGCL